jgi:hypothetical protein
LKKICELKREIDAYMLGETDVGGLFAVLNEYCKRGYDHELSSVQQRKFLDLLDAVESVLYMKEEKARAILEALVSSFIETLSE